MTDSYYTGVDRGRCTVNIVLGLVLTAVAVLLIAKLMPTTTSYWVEHPSIHSRILAFGIFFVLFLLLAAGCRLLWAFASNEEKITRITASGICTHDSVVLWPSVTRIGSGRINKKIELLYHVKGERGPRLIPSDDGLTEREYDELVDVLRKYVGEKYPEISIGEQSAAGNHP